MFKKSGLSRRRFLKISSFMVGAATLVPAVSFAAVGGNDGAKHTMGDMNNSSSRAIRGKMFFTNELDFNTISAASERIFPKDSTGPGAIELGVPYFIDNQLAGAFGYNAREYTSGPFAVGAPTQGYQTPLLRKDIFLHGAIALNRQSNTTFKKNFPEITDAQQDQILKMCESGGIATEGFTSSYFFALLRGAVLAGVYADPIYNGNNNMDGWRMKGFPGAQMEYVDTIEKKGFNKIEPVSLADMAH